MSAVVASGLAWALAFAGMAALAFAIDRHYEQLTGARTLPRARAAQLRGLGVPLLVAALLPCVATWGATVGCVAWLGFLSAGALASVAAISAAPRWAARAAWGLGASALLALGWAWM